MKKAPMNEGSLFHVQWLEKMVDLDRVKTLI